MNGESKKFLISAIVWTTICVLALGILIFGVQSGLFPKICGLVLIILCLSGQWLRYIKSRRG